MKIYIKTPLYKDSKYIAHLLEHTIGNGGEIKDFFKNFNSDDLRKLIGKESDYKNKKNIK